MFTSLFLKRSGNIDEFKKALKLGDKVHEKIKDFDHHEFTIDMTKGKDGLVIENK